MGYLKAALMGSTTSLLCTLLLLSTAYARADERAPKSFDIPPQGMAAALSEFARQSHEEILFAPDVVAEKRSGGVRGTMQPLAALKILLNDSGLPFSSTPSGAILIGQAGASSVISTADASDSSQKEGKKDSSPGFRVAQLDQASTGTTALEKGSDQNLEKKGLTEIVVTAQKREQRLQDVPVPVTAIDAQTLLNNNQLRIQDYYTTVPGFVTTPVGTSASGQFLSVRGISTGAGGNPTVGVTVDDIPYGASTFGGGSAFVPDLDPGDLARIEVLRGPQGTLYGASSMGGLLKFVTLDPSTDAVSGRMQFGTSSVYNGAQLGSNVRGSVNVPLSDTWAIRASAFTRQDPGYIDDPTLGIDGVNKAEAYGAHITTLWRPSDALSLKLGALWQQIRGNGNPDVDNRLPGLEQDYLRGTGEYERTNQAYSAILNAKIGNAELMALSGYSINKRTDSFDDSFYVGFFIQNGANGVPGYGVGGAKVPELNSTDKFTQEVRLSLPIGPRIQWLSGAFYTHETSTNTQQILAVDPSTGTSVGTFYDSGEPSSYDEYAVFTDLTVHFTDRFEVQFGGRESEIKQSFGPQFINGPYAPELLLVPSPVIEPELHSKANVFTYLVTPQLKLTPDLMIYARLASGYRPGGSNAAPEPPNYSPDKTRNYEIGVKGDFLDHVLSVDASVYYIDWKNIQLSLTDQNTGNGYITNVSGAKSQGVELSVQSRPLAGMTVGAWIAFDDAVLTHDIPAGSFNPYGVAGDRLPYSSRFSGNISLDQEFHLIAHVTGFVGGTISYVGDREGEFNLTPPSPPPRQSYPAFTKVDLRGGARFDSWTANLFVTNLANKRGVLEGGLNGFLPFAFQYIEPRTVGLNVSRSF